MLASTVRAFSTLLLLPVCALVVSQGSAVPPAGSPGCAGMVDPVPGPVIRVFAPLGRYAGHWGIDLAAPLGSRVVAVAAGRVVFAGTVAGNRTVTVDHGGGLRTSYSYLEAVTVATGTLVRAGAALGRSGRAHDSEALHLSARIGDHYVDPADLLDCRWGPPARALRLVAIGWSPNRAYAVGRATRHPRRNL